MIVHCVPTKYSTKTLPLSPPNIVAVCVQNHAFIMHACDCCCCLGECNSLFTHRGHLESIVAFSQGLCVWLCFGLVADYFLLPLQVIARFGIQKTDINHRDDTNGYAFGNITLLNHGQFDPGKSDAPHSPPANIYNNAVMLFVNRTLFKHIYNIFTEFNREHETEVREHPLDFQQSNLTTHLDELKSNFCANVYETIKHSHYDEKCNNQSKQSLDFVRYVPCQNGKLCNDPYQSHNLTNYQFTYVIDNQNEPT